jgi:hypothetical protein
MNCALDIRTSLFIVNSNTLSLENFSYSRALSPAGDPSQIQLRAVLKREFLELNDTGH